MRVCGCYICEANNRLYVRLGLIKIDTDKCFGLRATIRPQKFAFAFGFCIWSCHRQQATNMSSRQSQLFGFCGWPNGYLQFHSYTGIYTDTQSEREGQIEQVREIRL